ncbi:MAG TPA: T9SS type A sorting domain-containing protein, partial [Bacteroidota bacterium]|nr:T9SS type A sorting domain-containing protein [Bacteroidota bacterium]
YDLMSIPVNQTGTGTGTFELIPAGFADGADPYLEIGEAGEVLDYGNPFYQNATVVALPVELVSFTVSAEKQSAVLNWKTATERNNAGFDIERAAVRVSESEKKWSKVGHVDGNGTCNAPKAYAFKNKNIQSGKYAYRLKQIDRDGAFTYSQEVEAEIAVPTEFALSQNYPNPFNPATTVNYSVARKGAASIKIYDITGREVKTVFDEVKEAGYYSVSIDCSSMATGVYLYRMTAVNGGAVFTDTKRFVLLK